MQMSDSNDIICEIVYYNVGIEAKIIEFDSINY